MDHPESDFPSKEEFAQLFMERLRSAGEEREISYDADEFRILFNGGTDSSKGTINLSNLYLEFQRVDEAERDNFLSLLLRSTFSHLKPMPEEFEFAAYDIRPKIWSRGTVEQINLQKKINGEPTLNWPLESVGEHLYVSLVYDLPESVRSISGTDLEDWGTNFWEARERAISNLSDVEFQCVDMGDELFVSTTGDAYDATRIILPGLVDQFELPGRPIAMIPNRESLLLTGLESESGMKLMIELATQQLVEFPRPIIGTPLVLSDEGYWEDWFPEPTHPLFRDFQKLRVVWRNSEYETQQDLLIQFLAGKGNAAMAAGYQVVESEGLYRGLAMLVNGIPTLVPDVEWVAVVDPDSQEVTAVCDFPSLRSMVGEKIEKSQKFYPYRFLAHGTLSETEIEQTRVDVEL